MSETFTDLVDREYIAQGFTRFAALMKIYLGSGVNVGSLRAAYRGLRVNADTANKLMMWAASTHKAELDVEALLMAPQRRPRVPNAPALPPADDKIIEAAAARLAHELGGVADLAVCVVVKNGKVGEWQIFSRDRREAFVCGETYGVAKALARGVLGVSNGSV